MYLLNIQDGSAVAQVIIGAGVLITTIISIGQSKKIKELSVIARKLAEQTKELSNQTSELKKLAEINGLRYELELSLSLRDRIPFFTKEGRISQHAPWKYVLSLINEGKSAENVAAFIDAKPDDVDVSFPSPNDIQSGEVYQIEIIPPSRMILEAYNIIAFELRFNSMEGLQYVQRVWIYNGMVSVMPPFPRIN